MTLKNHLQKIFKFWWGWEIEKKVGRILDFEQNMCRNVGFENPTVDPLTIISDLNQ